MSQAQARPGRQANETGDIVTRFPLCEGAGGTSAPDVAIAKVGEVVTRQEEVSSDLSTAAYPASKRAFTPCTEKSRAPVIGT